MTEIKLTTDQLDTVKDEVKFRTTVLLTLDSMKEKYLNLNCKDHGDKMENISKLAWIIQGQLLIMWAVLALIINKTFM